ncbi:SDR family NAD(P)-dependent oxidoreductase, partial [Rhizobium leguminosarum]
KLLLPGVPPVGRIGVERELVVDAGIGDEGMDLSRPDGVCTLWCDALAAAGRSHAGGNDAGLRNEIAIDADPSDGRAAGQKEF